MSDLVKWDPYSDVERMRDTINNIFSPNWWPSRFFEGSSFSKGMWGPSVDIREDNNNIIITAEIPGVSGKDLDVTISEDRVVMKGEVKHHTDSSQYGYHRVERRYGSFHRSIPLPVPVNHEQATAKYKDGILEIIAPKTQFNTDKVRRLTIESGDTDHPSGLH
jgi:HSP20 family protein